MHERSPHEGYTLTITLHVDSFTPAQIAQAKRVCGEYGFRCAGDLWGNPRFQSIALQGITHEQSQEFIAAIRTV